MQNHPSEKPNIDDEALRPHPWFRSGRIRILILACVFAVLQRCIPEDVLSAAPQSNSDQNGGINLVLPTFNGPTQQATTAPSMPRYQGPQSFADSDWPGTPLGNREQIRIVPRSRSDGNVAAGMIGIEPTEPLPFSPTRSQESRQIGHLPPQSPNDASTVPFATAAEHGSSLPLTIPFQSEQPARHSEAPLRMRPSVWFPTNGTPRIMPNTTGRIAKQFSDTLEKAPPALDEIPVPIPAASKQSGTTDSVDTATGSKGSAEGAQNAQWDSWSRPPISRDDAKASVETERPSPAVNTLEHASQADRASQTTAAVQETQESIKEPEATILNAKIKADSWSVLPDPALLKASRAIDESFRRSVVAEESQAENSTPAALDFAEGESLSHQAAGSAPLNDKLKAPAAQRPANGNRALQQPAPQNPATQLPLPNPGVSARELQQAPLTIPGFSSEHQSPAIVSPGRGNAFESFPLREPLYSTPDISPVPQQNSNGSGDNGYDYRFDAQFQSTIKPHLRWHMRNDPDRPGERYLPRYLTSQGDSYGSQGYGCTTGGCSAPGSGCDGGRGSIGYGAGNQPRSNYWQHLDYLYQQYGSTAQRPRRRSSQSSATHNAAPSPQQHNPIRESQAPVYGQPAFQQPAPIYDSPIYPQPPTQIHQPHSLSPGGGGHSFPEQPQAPLQNDTLGGYSAFGKFPIR